MQNAADPIMRNRTTLPRPANATEQNSEKDRGKRLTQIGVDETSED